MEQNKNNNKEDGKRRLNKLKEKISDLVEFLTHDLWRVDSQDVSGKRNVFYNGLKTIIMTVRNSLDLNLNARAASLTYRTLLSLVPGLAVLFAVARGFGLQNII